MSSLLEKKNLGSHFESPKYDSNTHWSSTAHGHKSPFALDDLFGEWRMRFQIEAEAYRGTNRTLIYGRPGNSERKREMQASVGGKFIQKDGLRG